MQDADSVRAEPGYAKTIHELRDLDDDALIAQHDALVHGGNPVGLEYYLDELRRREADSREQRMATLTRKMVILTRVIAFLAVVNVALVLVAVLK
jgi:hypothetical protein